MYRQYNRESCTLFPFTKQFSRIGYFREMAPLIPSETFRPSLQLLGPEQISAIHGYSIRILEETGIRVESKSALDIFRRSNAVRINGDVVCIQQELVEHSIQQAPSSIEVFNKKGSHAFHLGEKQGHHTHFGIGVTNTWFQDIESGDVALFKRQHTRDAASLGNLLDNYAMLSTPGIPSDVGAEVSDLYSALDMYANTDKPLVLLISGEGRLQSVLELLSHLHGDLSEKPFCIPYVNPITPLVLNKETTDKMMVSIEHQLPLMYSNYGMYGGTSPVTEAGTLALLNAELLAGLVFSQLIREGSQIILGSLPAAFNMASMGSYYTPTSYLLNLACAEIMQLYQIPHCGTSGSNNGRGADLSSSGQLWLNHLTSCLGKVGCAPFVGGNFESLAFSPAMVVLGDHIISEARKFAAGFSINDQTVNLQEIVKVGHGGDFFTSDQTLESLSGTSIQEELWPIMSLESWKDQGMPSHQDSLITRASALYEQAQKASLENSAMVHKGEAFITGTLVPSNRRD